MLSKHKGLAVSFITRDRVTDYKVTTLWSYISVYIYSLYTYLDAIWSCWRSKACYCI